MLAAHIDRLATEEKELLQHLAVMGREFPLGLVKQAFRLPEDELYRLLSALQSKEFLYEQPAFPEVEYIFKHALTQEVAYGTVLQEQRKALHERTGQAMEALHAENLADHYSDLAHHYSHSGNAEKAVEYLSLAGQQAQQRSANQEAVQHLRTALALLERLPDTQARLQQELDLQVALGPALFATKGFAAPDVERAYARARELCQQLGDTPQLFPVLRGLMLYYLSRGQTQTAYQLGEQMLCLAQSQSEPALLLLAHHLLGHVLFFRGEPAAAHTHYMQELAIYNPQEHRALLVRYGTPDLGVLSRSFLALELWQLGYPDQAMQHIQEALTLAQEMSHPYTLVHVLVSAATFHQFSRELPAAHEQAEAAAALATEQGFAYWLARGTVLHGWALAMQEQAEQGIAEIRQGLAADLATGAKVMQPYYLGLLAEAYGEGGHPEEGLPLLAEALAVMDNTELHYYGAELYRLKGALLLRQAVPDASQAEACFHQALDVARAQQATSLELRAAMSLARLWQQQDKHQDARDLITPVYDWFTEGFDTADLQEARALLDELKGSQS